MTKHKEEKGHLHTEHEKNASKQGSTTSKHGAGKELEKSSKHENKHEKSDNKGWGSEKEDISKKY